MRKKVGMYALCLFLLAYALAGCASMTPPEKRRGTDAAVGWGHRTVQRGNDGNSPQVKGVGQSRPGPDGIVGRRPPTGAGQGAPPANTPQVAVKIENTAAKPQQLEPGDQVVLEMNYTVLAPPEKGRIQVREVRIILFNEQQVAQFVKHARLSPGTHVQEARLNHKIFAREKRPAII